ncbi:adenylate/guanylate cyclase domain-containing protein [Actinomycetospora endophytica]|uniref:Adenylate/guanylate cyclase domain-containing protein n=1 Tax=Actinomycetospora endophytica TaxID=2291215 RepID=A0ABS8P975_9PSEU|nr:adenylate/guanylate cyclase domain-containing protein [Actinomycetospora endophytica]MCD2194075.1 adenylate/guanylate cyclase domain-containing protein [Actinomycetospora endophytica]
MTRRVAHESAVARRDRDIAGLGLFTRLTLVLVVVLPNLVGAGVVLVLAAWVLPTDVLISDPGALTRNLLVFGPYLAVAVVFGAWWGHRRMRVPPVPAGADDATRERVVRRLRRVVLRGPLRLALVQAVLWAIAAVLFVLLNVFSSGRLGFQVGSTVVLGGVVVVSITYRLVEVVLRPAVRRVLSVRPPSGGVLPGVLMRTVGGWLFGTAAPLLGVLLAASGALAFGGYSVDRLAVVVMVLSAVALVFGGTVITLTAMSTAAPVLAVRRALRRVESGDYDVDVPIFDTTELGLLQAGFNTMVAGLRERERVRDLFGRQVGEDVARNAMENELELGGEVREVAVLFVDVVGSTTLAATRPPTEVVELLNQFFALVVDVVEEHGGWINKFEGDAALAVFGVPTGLSDAAGAALGAGRVLGSRLAAEVFDASGQQVRAGIGISAGEAVAGNVGDRRRYEYTVIGDPVNEAARLCDVAKETPDGVAASGAALSRASAREAERWTGIGSRHLRGRTAETEVVVPRRSAGSPPEDSSSSGPGSSAPGSSAPDSSGSGSSSPDSSGSGSSSPDSSEGALQSN